MGRPSAVDEQGLARDEARRVAREVQQRPVELVLVPRPPHRRVAPQPLGSALVVEHLGGHLAVEPSGSDRVHAHAPPGPLRGELPGHVDHATLRRGVGGLRQDADAHGPEHRGDVHDAAAVGVDHVLRDPPGETEGAGEIDAEHAVELVVALLQGRLGHHCPGVVHQYVDPTEALQRRLDERVQVGGLRHVAGHGERVVELVGRRRDPLLPSRREDHLRPGPVEDPCETRAESGARAGDDGDAVVEAEGGERVEDSHGPGPYRAPRVGGTSRPSRRASTESACSRSASSCVATSVVVPSPRASARIERTRSRQSSS